MSNILEELQEKGILADVFYLAHEKEFNEFCAKIAPCFMTKQEWDNKNRRVAFLLKVAKIYVEDREQDREGLKILQDIAESNLKTEGSLRVIYDLHQYYKKKES